MKLFVHTKKAVACGCPENRVFFVVNEFVENRKTWYNAWKVTVVKGGLDHPAFALGTQVKKILTNGFKSKSRNGSEPTAQFYKDSFYKEITENELMDMIFKSSYISPRMIAKKKENQCSKFIESLTRDQINVLIEMLEHPCRYINQINDTLIRNDK